MPVTVRKPPTPDLVAAVNSVSNKISFQSAYYFSIQPLASLCDPTHGLKAIQALNLGVIPRLSPALVKFADDAECSRSILKIFASMTHQLAEDGTADEIERFMKDQGYESTCEWLAKTDLRTRHITIIQLAFAVVTNLQKCNAPINPASLAKALLGKVSAQTPPQVAALCLQIVRTCAQTSAGISAIGSAKGTETILTFLCSLHEQKLADSAVMTQILSDGIGTLHHLVAAKQWKTSDLTSMLFLADMYSSNAKIKADIAALLSQMYTMEDFEKCLKALQQYSPGTAQHKEALSMLTPMSYVTDFADSVVVSGGIPFLVHAVDVCVKSLEEDPSSQDSIRGLVGGCKMLGAIAGKPTNIPVITQAGGLRSAISAMRAAQGRPDCAAAACAMAAPLLYEYDNATVFLNESGVDVMVGCLAEDAEVSNEMLSTSARVVYGIAQHTDLVPSIASVDLYWAFICHLQPSTPSVVIADVLHALSAMGAGLESAQIVVEAQLMDAINNLLQDRANDLVLVEASALCVSAHCQIADADSTLVQSPAAAILLSSISKVSGNRAVEEACVAGLQRIAGPEDLKRIMTVLREQFANAERDTPDLTNTLRSVGALAQCTNIAPLMKNQQVGFEVLKACAALMEKKAFPGRGDLIEAAIPVVIGIELALNQSVQGTLEQLLGFVCADSFKKDRDVAAAKLPLVLKQTKDLVASGRWDEKLMPRIVGAVVDLMKKFPEAKDVNIAAIDLLNELMRLMEKPAADLILSEKAYDLCITYAQKVRVYEDVQIVVFELIELLLIFAPEQANRMRTAVALDIIRTAQTLHGRNTEVKRLLNNVAWHLMPTEFLEKQLQDECKRIKMALDQNDWVSVEEGLATVGAYTSTTEGARLAQKIALSSTVALVSERLSGCPEKVILSGVIGHVTQIAKDMTTTLPDAKASAKQGMMEAMITVVNNLGDDVKTHAADICNALTALRTMMRAVRVQDSPVPGQVEATLKKFVASSGKDVTSLTRVAEFLAAGSSEKNASTSCYKGIMDFLLKELNSKDGAAAGAAAEALSIMARDIHINRVLMRMKAEDYSNKAIQRHKGDQMIFGSIAKLLESLCRPNAQALVDLGEATLCNRIRETCGLIPEAMELSTVEALVRATLAYTVTCPNPRTLAGDEVVTEGLLRAKAVCADNTELTEAITKIYKSINGEGSGTGMMQKIIRLCREKPAHWETSVEHLCDELSIYLHGRFRKLQDIYNQAGDLVETMERLLSHDAHFLPTSGAALAALEGLSRSAPRNHDSVTAITSNILPIIAAHFADAAKVPSGAASVPAWQKDRKVVMRGFGLMEQLLTRSDMQGEVLKTIAQFELGSRAYYLMREVYSGDAEVIVALQRFANALADAPDGLALLEKQIRSKKISLDSIADVVISMKDLGRLRGPDGINALTSLADMFARMDQKEVGKLVMRPLFQEQLAQAAKLSPGHLLGVIGVLMSSEMCIQDKKMNTKIKDLVATLMEEVRQRELNPDIRSDLMTGIAGLLERRRLRVGMKDFIDICGDLASEIIRDGRMQDGHVLQFAKGFDRLYADPEFTDMMLEVLQGVLARAVEREDDDLAMIVMEEYLMKLKNNGEDLSRVYALPEYKQFEKWLEERSEMEDCLPELLQLWTDWKVLEPGIQEPDRTLRQLLLEWETEIEEGREISMMENAAVYDHLQFLAQNARLYADSPIPDCQDERGLELSAGLKCLLLLAGHEANDESLAEFAPEEIIAAVLREQNDHCLITEACVSGVDNLWYESVRQQFARIPDSRACVVRTLVGALATPSEHLNLTDLVYPRLQFFSLTAVKRTDYDNTPVVPTFIDYWKCVEKGTMEIKVLQIIFRSLRTIASPWILEQLRVHKFPEKLKVLVTADRPVMVIMPDLYYLVGALAGFPSMKDHFCKLGFAGDTVEFVRRSRKFQGPDDDPTLVTRGITNALLSLGALGSNHPGNAADIMKHQGLELAVEILKDAEKADEFPVEIVNADSILMCNITFKRDDIKTALCDLKAPQAITKALKKLVLSTEESSEIIEKCIINLLRTVSNLCMEPLNRSAFISNHISVALQDVLRRFDVFSADVIHMAVLCVFDLVCDATVGGLKDYGEVTSAIMDLMYYMEVTESMETWQRGLLVLAATSRLAENAQLILQHEAFPTVQEQVQTLGEQAVASSFLSLMCSMASHSDLVYEMLERGCVQVTTELLWAESSAEEICSDIVIRGLITVQRMMVDISIHSAFWELDGHEIVRRLVAQAVYSAPVVREAYRLLLNIITLYGSQEAAPAEETDPNWRGDVAEEGMSALDCQIERPPEPRAWEQAWFTGEQMSAYAEFGSRALGSDLITQQPIVQSTLLLWLAYTACEKPRGGYSGFFAGAFFDNVERLMQDPAREDDLSLIHSIAVNVCSVADDQCFAAVKGGSGFISGGSAFVKQCGRVSKMSFASELGKTSLAPAYKELYTLLATPATTQMDLWHLSSFDLWVHTNNELSVASKPVYSFADDSKAALVAGGSALTVIKTSLRSEKVHWRANKSLTRFTYHVGELPKSVMVTYQNSIPIMEIVDLQPGLASPELQAANRSSPLLYLDYKCLTVRYRGIALEVIDLNMVFSTERKRDLFLLLLQNWQCAQMYNET